MKKHIALGIAAVVLGATGVASAVMSYDDITSAAGSKSSFETTTDQLAANCWVVTGGGQDAGCTTSAAGVDLPNPADLADLPGIDGVDLDSLTGLVGMAGGVGDGATGAVPSPEALVSQVQALIAQAKSMAGGAVPSACNLPVSSLPAQVPVPQSIFSAGAQLFHKVEVLAMNHPAPQALPQVKLPVAGVPSADEVIDLTQGELDCLAGLFGGSLPIDVPAVCSVEAGAPSAVKDAIPGDISGLLATAVQELQSLTGQSVNIAGSNYGASCNFDAAAEAIPADVTGTVDSVVGTVTKAVPAPSSVTGQAGSVAGSAGSIAGNVAGTATGTATGTVTDATGTVTDAVDTVTGLTDTVDSTLDTVTGIADGLVPTSSPDCSASANTSGGLLGSLTATISGGCK